MLREGDITPEEAAIAGTLYDDLDSALVASGFEDVFDVFTTSITLRTGDIWLCVSDGVHGAVPDIEIAAVLRAGDSSPKTIVASLMDAARTNRLLDDNLSAVAVRVI